MLQFLIQQRGSEIPLHAAGAFACSKVAYKLVLKNIFRDEGVFVDDHRGRTSTVKL
jgi:hypothetical protein